MFIKQLFGTILTAGLLFAAAPASAQISTPAPSPAASLTQTVGLTEVEISYSRPSVKGRTIFGELVPYDKIWRTGANGATTISFSDDVVLGGAELTAGTYALYTKPGKEMWTVMVYSDLSMGGNVAAYDEANEVARFEVKPSILPFPVESMMFAIDDITSESATIMLIWEKTSVAMDLEVSVDENVMAQIEQVMAGPSANDYRAAAVYYYNTDREMDKALEWINKCIEMGGDRYWIHTDRARILGKMGKKTEAIAASKKAMAMAQEAGNMDYVKINEGLLAEWGN